MSVLAFAPARRRLENELIASARVGSPEVYATLAVLADLLAERGDPLGPAIARVLRDRDLQVLGLERFRCQNVIEGDRRADVLVCRHRALARALWLPPHLRAVETELVMLPALGERAEFVMGGGPGERAGHDEMLRPVRFGQAFMIGRAAVTQQLYDGLHGEHDPYDWPGDGQPANQMSWDEAEDFAQELGMRLPSEAEWEYAARGGTRTAYCFGDAVTSAEVNYGRGDMPMLGSPVGVGRLPANAYGLHEVHGNLREWVADDWALYDFAPLDGRAHHDPSASERVCRGGSCHDPAWACRSGARCAEDPYQRHELVGFRLARDV